MGCTFPNRVWCQFSSCNKCNVFNLDNYCASISVQDSRIQLPYMMSIILCVIGLRFLRPNIIRPNSIHVVLVHETLCCLSRIWLRKCCATQCMFISRTPKKDVRFFYSYTANDDSKLRTVWPVFTKAYPQALYFIVHASKRYTPQKPSVISE